MRLLLDEMWSGEIASQLRARGHDVVAIVELPDLRSQLDFAIFQRARSEGRAIVTENFRDFSALARGALESGATHSGVVFTSIHRFPRGDPRTMGRMIRSLEQLLSDDRDLTNQEWWLPESTP